MSLFERVSEQIQTIEFRLNSLRRELNHAKNSPASAEAALGEVDASAKELHRFIGHLNLFYDVLTQLDGDLTLNEAIAQAVHSIWQKIPLSYAVVILGEAELGPYHYYNMQGIEKASDYIGKECPFPLSGVLAQTLLCKQDPATPDYFCIDDIRVHKRPTLAEFPWLPMHGSLLIVPLRLNNRSVAKGVLLVGRSVQGGFADPELRQEFSYIAKNLAQLIHHAQMRYELSKQTEQLVNVQLLTREIAQAQSVDELLYTLSQKTAEAIRNVEVAVYLRSVEAIYDQHLDPNEPALYLYESGGYGKPLLSVQMQQLFAWTMRAGEPVFYHPHRLYAEPEHPFYSIAGPAMVVPIVGKGYTFGVIQVTTLDEGHQLDETDTLVMRSIANSVAVVLKGLNLEVSKAQSLISSLQSLIAAAEEQTENFGGHSQRVAHNAGLMARRLGYDDQSWSYVRSAALLHNISILIQHQLQWRHIESDAREKFQQQISFSSSLLNQLGIHATIVHLVEQMAHPYGGHEVLGTWVNTWAMQSESADAQAGHSRENASVPMNYSETQELTQHRNSSRGQYAWDVLNSAMLASQVIYLADLFDTWLCTLPRRQVNSIEAQLQYLDAQSGITVESALVELFQLLLKENQLLLPVRMAKRGMLQKA